MAALFDRRQEMLARQHEMIAQLARAAVVRSPVAYEEDASSIVPVLG